MKIWYVMFFDDYPVRINIVIWKMFIKFDINALRAVVKINALIEYR